MKSQIGLIRIELPNFTQANSRKARHLPRSLLFLAAVTGL
jgi:hypothetical protein